MAVIRVPVRPVLTETLGSLTIEWFCVPPETGEVFRVTDQEWNEDFSVRKIYEWKRSTHIVDCGDFSLKVVPAWE